MASSITKITELDQLVSDSASAEDRFGRAKGEAYNGFFIVSSATNNVSNKLSAKDLDTAINTEIKSAVLVTDGSVSAEEYAARGGANHPAVGRALLHVEQDIDTVTRNDDSGKSWTPAQKAQARANIIAAYDHDVVHMDKDTYSDVSDENYLHRDEYADRARFNIQAASTHDLIKYTDAVGYIYFDGTVASGSHGLDEAHPVMTIVEAMDACKARSTDGCKYYIRPVNDESIAAINTWNFDSRVFDSDIRIDARGINVASITLPVSAHTTGNIEILADCNVYCSAHVNQGKTITITGKDVTAELFMTGAAYNNGSYRIDATGTAKITKTTGYDNISALADAIYVSANTINVEIKITCDTLDIVKTGTANLKNVKVLNDSRINTSVFAGIGECSFGKELTLAGATIRFYGTNGFNGNMNVTADRMVGEGTCKLGGNSEFNISGDVASMIEFVATDSTKTHSFMMDASSIISIASIKSDGGILDSISLKVSENAVCTDGIIMPENSDAKVSIDAAGDISVYGQGIRAGSVYINGEKANILDIEASSVNIDVNKWVVRQVNLVAYDSSKPLSVVRAHLAVVEDECDYVFNYRLCTANADFGRIFVNIDEYDNTLNTNTGSRKPYFAHLVGDYGTPSVKCDLVGYIGTMVYREAHNQWEHDLYCIRAEFKDASQGETEYTSVIPSTVCNDNVLVGNRADMTDIYIDGMAGDDSHEGYSKNRAIRSVKRLRDMLTSKRGIYSIHVVSGAYTPDSVELDFAADSSTDTNTVPSSIGCVRVSMESPYAGITIKNAIVSGLFISGVKNVSLYNVEALYNVAANLSSIIDVSATCDINWYNLGTSALTIMKCGILSLNATNIYLNKQNSAGFDISDSTVVFKASALIRFGKLNVPTSHVVCSASDVRGIVTSSRGTSFRFTGDGYGEADMTEWSIVGSCVDVNNFNGVSFGLDSLCCNSKVIISGSDEVRLIKGTTQGESFYGTELHIEANRVTVGDTESPDEPVVLPRMSLYVVAHNYILFSADTIFAGNSNSSAILDITTDRINGNPILLNACRAIIRATNIDASIYMTSKPETDIPSPFGLMMLTRLNLNCADKFNGIIYLNGGVNLDCAQELVAHIGQVNNNWLVTAKGASDETANVHAVICNSNYGAYLHNDAAGKIAAGSKIVYLDAPVNVLPGDGLDTRVENHETVVQMDYAETIAALRSLLTSNAEGHQYVRVDGYSSRFDSAPRYYRKVSLTYGEVWDDIPNSVMYVKDTIGGNTTAVYVLQVIGCRITAAEAGLTGTNVTNELTSLCAAMKYNGTVGGVRWSKPTELSLGSTVITVDAGEYDLGMRVDIGAGYVSGATKITTVGASMISDSYDSSSMYKFWANLGVFTGVNAIWNGSGTGIELNNVVLGPGNNLVMNASAKFVKPSSAVYAIKFSGISVEYTNTGISGDAYFTGDVKWGIGTSVAPAWITNKKRTIVNTNIGDVALYNNCDYSIVSEQSNGTINFIFATPVLDMDTYGFTQFSSTVTLLVKPTTSGEMPHTLKTTFSYASDNGTAVSNNTISSIVIAPSQGGMKIQNSALYLHAGIYRITATPTLVRCERVDDTGVLDSVSGNVDYRHATVKVTPVESVISYESTTDYPMRGMFDNENIELDLSGLTEMAGIRVSINQAYGTGTIRFTLPSGFTMKTGVTDETFLQVKCADAVVKFPSRVHFIKDHTYQVSVVNGMGVIVDFDADSGDYLLLATLNA